MTCRSVRRWVRGGMPMIADDLRIRILDHAGACVRCGRLVHEAEAVRAALAVMGRPISPPAGFAERVARSLGAGRPEPALGDLAWRYARWALPAGVGLALVLAAWTFLGNGNGNAAPVGQFLAQAELPREEAMVVFGGREPTLGQVLISVVGGEVDWRE